MQLSNEKIDKIKESILSYLFKSSPKLIFTAEIAFELARDEEFVKRLILEMEKKGLTVGVRKNSDGTNYLRRIRWRLSSKVYDAYLALNNQK